MGSMVLRELFMLVLSIAALGGGTACIIHRDRRWNSRESRSGGEDSGRSVEFIPQNHAA